MWQSAVQYHAWHALALIATGLAGLHLEGSWIRTAGWLFIAGVVLFSGSLYALALGAPRGLGAVTPIGGVMFILGWIAFAIGVIYARTPG